MFYCYYNKVQEEIYSLSPNTLYEIQIWASNEMGSGKKTELTIRTKSEMTESGKLLFFFNVYYILKN